MKVAAVIVTYNRLHLLKECIGAVKGQSTAPGEIFIINNSSTDGTEDWLNQQTGLTVIKQENLGSSGGQYTGIKTAFEKGYEWIWCMDDDTIPQKDALQNLLSAKAIAGTDTGFICSNVLWTDGSLHAMNTHAPASLDFYTTVLDQQLIELKTCSFVSVLFSAQAIKKVGYPIRDFFVWYDDVEYTYRITSNGFKGYIKLDSIACHKTIKNEAVEWSSITKENFVKYKHGIRNFIALQGYVFKHPGFLHRLKYHTTLISTFIKIGLKQGILPSMIATIYEGYTHKLSQEPAL